jgi:serine protease Do
VQPITTDIAGQLNIKPDTKGLVVTDVDPSGPAAYAGIQPGDVIQQINNQPIRSAADIRPALQKSVGKPALLLINRGGHPIFVPVRPK